MKIQLDFEPLVSNIRNFQAARFCLNCGQERGWHVGTCLSGGHYFARHRYGKGRTTHTEK